MNDDLRFPVGKFVFPDTVSAKDRARYIDEIAATPRCLREAVQGLDEKQLATPYRPGGWTVRQVVHHLPDSHMNSYSRFKLALTEEEPVIKAYDEAKWAELADSGRTPVEVSLALMDALHERWVVLLRSLDAEALARRFQHPEIGPVTVEQNIALYAWHGRHHVAHITALRTREGW